MDAILTPKKRKIIELPEETLRKLSILASAHGRSLKAYIEQLLNAKADSIKITVEENPSPSRDKWFDNRENMDELNRAVAESRAGHGREISLEELQQRLSQ